MRKKCGKKSEPKIETSSFVKHNRKEIINYAKSIEAATSNIKIKDFSANSEKEKKAASFSETYSYS